MPSLMNPLDEMNTSMTINAHRAWFLALYVARRRGDGIERSQLKGTTQNDIIKEYLSRCSAGALDAADRRRRRVHRQ